MKKNASEHIMNRNKGRFEKLTNPPKIDKSKPLYKKKGLARFFNVERDPSKVMNKKIQIGTDYNFNTSVKITVCFVLVLSLVYVFLNLSYSGAILAQKADKYYAEENYSNAAKYYDKAIRLDFSTPEVLRNYAFVLAKLQNYDYAIDKLTAALEQDPKSSDILYDLANVIYLKGKRSNDFDLFIRAANYLKEAISLSPSKEESYLLISLCYRSAGQYQEARQWYNKALTIKESSKTRAEFYNLIGHTFAEEEKYSEAIGYYRRALETDPAYFAAYISIGDTYNKLNDMNSALQNYKRVVDANPNFIDGYIRMGNLYFERQRYEESAQWYLAALKINPDNIDANYLLGLAYKNLGRNDEAVEYLKNAAYYGKDDAIDELKNIGAGLNNVL
ncbi:MAG: tetratricopeptide repeat protein [Elusimicrobiota bacterium]|jgi:tetratricopeptide (TPR) repeat protein|nr:tetratricopeptide repeat protein [Elusimicrobiota bacterium]